MEQKIKISGNKEADKALSKVGSAWTGLTVASESPVPIDRKEHHCPLPKEM